MKINVELTLDDKGAVLGIKQVGDTAKRTGDDVEKFQKKVSLTSRILQGIGQGIGQRIFDGFTSSAWGAIEAIGALAERGSEVSNVAGSFEALAGIAQQSSSDMLSGFREGTRGLVADFELMQAANRGLLLGLPLTAGEMKTLGETAVALGKAMNVSATQAIGDLITGLGRGSALILDNLGIIVNEEQAYQRYAASIGKSAQALTDAEKKTAVYRDAIAAASKKVAEMGGVHLTFADRVKIGQVALQNMRDTIGRAIAESPALAVLMERISTAVLKAFDGSAPSLERWIQIVNRVAQALVTLAQVGVSLAKYIGIAYFGLVGLFNQVAAGALSMVAAIQAAFSGLYSLLVSLYEQMAKLMQSIASLPAPLAQALHLSTDAAAKAETQFRSLATGATSAAAGLEDAAKGTSALAGGFSLQAVEAQKSGDAWAKSLDGVSTWLDQVSSDMAKATRETRGFAPGATDKATKSTGDLGKQIKGLTDGMKAFFEQLAKKRQAQEDLRGLLGPSAQDATIEMGRLAAAVETYRHITELSNAELAKFIADMEAQRQLGGENAYAFGVLSRALTEAAQRGEYAAASFGFATKRTEELGMTALSTASKFQRVLSDALSSLPDVFDVIGLGDIGAGIGQAFEAIQRLDNAQSLGDIAQGLAGIVKGFQAATDSASEFKRALGGAAIGAQLGFQIGGGIGAAIGAVIGGVAGLFRKPGWVKAGRDAGRVLGMEVSKELAKQIEATAKSLNISFQAATLLNLDKAIEESGKSVGAFSGQIGQLFAGITNGSIPAGKGIEQLGTLFAKARSEAEAIGKTYSGTTVAMIRAARETGTSFAGMSEMVAAGLEKVAAGWSKIALNVKDGKFLSGLDPSLGFFAVTRAAEQAQNVARRAAQAAVEAVGKVSDATDEARKSALEQAAAAQAYARDMAGAAVDAQRQLDSLTLDEGKLGRYARAQGEFFTESFWAAAGELGIVEAADAFRKQFEGIRESFGEMLPKDTLDALLGPIERIMTLTAPAGDEGPAALFRGAAEAASGLKDVVDGLAESGYITADSLKNAGILTQNAFEQAMAGGATAKEALLAIKPALQAQLDAAAAYGLQLDDNTRSLVEQAEAMGMTFKVDPLMEMVDILRSIAKALGAELPQSASTAAASFARAGVAGAESANDAAKAWTDTAYRVATQADIAAASATRAVDDVTAASIAGAEATIMGWSKASDTISAGLDDLARRHLVIPVSFFREGEFPGGGGVGTGTIRPYVDSLPGYATGGIVTSPTVAHLAESGTEAVLTLPQLYQEMAGVVSSSTAGLLAGMLTSPQAAAMMMMPASGAPATALGASDDGEVAELLRAILQEQKALRRQAESDRVTTLKIGERAFGEAILRAQDRGNTRR